MLTRLVGKGLEGSWVTGLRVLELRVLYYGFGIASWGLRGWVLGYGVGYWGLGIGGWVLGIQKYKGDD